MHRVVAVAAFAVLALPALAPAGAAQVSAAPDVSRVAQVAPPKVGPIVATFKQADFATYYKIDVTPAPGAPKVTITWLLTPPKDDYGCRKFQQSATDPEEAVWKHGKGDGCNHAHQDGPRGHAGTVFVGIYDGVFHCTAIYLGTVSDTGDAPKCENAAIKDAIRSIESAISYEKIAISKMETDKVVFYELENARRELLDAKSAAVRGGAGPYAIRLIGEAADMDAAADELPVNSWKEATKILRAAIKLKEKALTLLRDRLR